MARHKKLLMVLVCIVFLLGVPAMVGNNAYIMLILCLSGIFVIASTGLDLLFGYSGQISIGHAAFYAVGAYTSAILSTKFGVSVWIGILMGGVLATLFAALALTATPALAATFSGPSPAGGSTRIFSPSSAAG